MTQISTRDFVVTFVALGEISRPQEVRVVEHVVLNPLPRLCYRNVHRYVDIFLIFNFLIDFLQFSLYSLDKTLWTKPYLFIATYQ